MQGACDAESDEGVWGHSESDEAMGELVSAWLSGHR